MATDGNYLQPQGTSGLPRRGGMALPAWMQRKRWSAPAGYVEDEPGYFVRRRPHPTGYIEESTFTRGSLGNVGNSHTRLYNPRQAELDTERSQFQEAQRRQPLAQPPMQPGAESYAMAGLRNVLPQASGPAAEDIEYEDYVDPDELARLVEQARSSFRTPNLTRSESYLDQEMLDRLRQQAEQEYQFTPEAFVDNPEARSLGFGRSKDQVGRLSRSALDSLREQMVERGLMGSSIEGRGMTDILSAGAGNLSDVLAGQESERAAAERAVNERNVAGRNARASQLAGVLPTLTSQAMRERQVADPGASQAVIEQYLAGLMPTLVASARRRRRVR